MRRLRFLSPLLLAVSVSTVAGVHVVHISGGDAIESAQGGIEANVVWSGTVLSPFSDDQAYYYGAGKPAAVKDVAFWEQRAAASEMAPLARIFVGGSEDRLRFRHNGLGHVDGGTAKASLVAALKEKFAATRPADELLVIYNGHGDFNHDDPRDNYLRLWGGERLSVSELDEIFDQAPAASTIRFIFPQDYSGAFARLVYDNPHADKPAIQNRCGFLAQSSRQSSEGYEFSGDEEAPRDYITYFFAPLAGMTRSGEALPNEPDLNQDGRLSYREAHLYALRNAQSRDRPRSTSEAFLEEWEPWYLRWDTLTENRDSYYWRLARELAERNSLNLDGQVLRQRGDVLRQQRRQVLDEQTSVNTEADKLKAQLQAEMRKRWPELFHPYSGAYRQVISQELAAINEAITGDRRYPMLVRAQDALLQLEQDARSYEGRIAEVERIIRYKRLARLEMQFERYANAEERSAYSRILSCENGSLVARPRSVDQPAEPSPAGN